MAMGTVDTAVDTVMGTAVDTAMDTAVDTALVTVMAMAMVMATDGLMEVTAIVMDMDGHSEDMGTVAIGMAVMDMDMATAHLMVTRMATDTRLMGMVATEIFLV